MGVQDHALIDQSSNRTKGATHQAKQQAEGTSHVALVGQQTLPVSKDDRLPFRDRRQTIDMPANDLLNAIARNHDNRSEDGPAITQVFRFRRAKQPVEHGLTLEAPLLLTGLQTPLSINSLATAADEPASTCTAAWQGPSSTSSL